MRRVAGSVLTVLLLFGLICAATAQEVRVFHGRVIWVDGTTIAFAPDSGGSFQVDVSQIDQASYEFLQSGDAITVAGVVTPDGTKLIATSITADR